MSDNPVTMFTVGCELLYGPITISKEEIIEFAKEFDPIFFHMDENAAKNSLLGGLAASGFHTCSLTMRMMCDAYLLNSTSQGAPETETIDWLGPVRPGDTLSGKSTVLTARRSRSRRDMLIVRFRHDTVNQNNEPVLSMVNSGFFRITNEASDDL